jgi:hypothetical protein
MKLGEYMAEVQRRTWATTHLRLGQIAYNLLSDCRKDLSEKVVGTEFDPFYDDSKLPAFYTWLAENWND